MIELSGVSKRYTSISWRRSFPPLCIKTVQALDNIELRISEGEIMGLLGPNGAGKTTIIKILATLISHDSGKATVCGLDLESRARQIRRRIGMVNTNDRSFYWRLTGRQNLDFFASLYDLDKSERNRRIAASLSRFDLESVADRPYMTLSSGQRQKIALVRALLPDPEILLLDEPTTSLDPFSAREFIGLVKAIAASSGSRTIIWCTHNLAEAESVCTSFCILKGGKVCARGPLSRGVDLQEVFDDFTAGK